MYKVIFLGFIIMSSLNGFAQQNPGDCNRFKTGKFSYKDSSGAIVNITRTKHRQTEKNTKTGLLTKLKINWPGECEYKLTQLWANSKKQRKNNRRTQTVRITKTDGNSYEYACNCNDPNQSKITGIVIRKND